VLLAAWGVLFAAWAVCCTVAASIKGERHRPILDRRSVKGRRTA
jgi:hypothetical protein